VLSCEVQVRTVLQDAWAIIDHHLVYKNEASVPKALRRKLNSLAGLFETADDQFQQIRHQREDYLEEMRDSSTSTEDFLAHEVNMDSVSEYLMWKLPGTPTEAFSAQLSRVLEYIPKDDFPDLLHLDAVMNETEQSRKRIRSELQESEETGKAEGQIPSSMELAWALCLKSDQFNHEVPFSLGWRRVIERERKKAGNEGPTTESNATSG